MQIGSIKGHIEELEKVWNIIERRKENHVSFWFSAG